jgi:hypothetical protein
VRRISLLTWCAVVASSGFAQGLIEPGKIAAANELFDSPLEGKRLNCVVEPRSPFLDFAFRFELGYIIRCPLRDFDGKPSRIASILRVTPEGGQAVLFGQNYRIPGMPRDLASTTDIRKVNAEISASGVVALGEGKYTVELALMDNRERVAHKKWKVTAARKRDEKKVQVMTHPFTATAVSTRLWPARPSPGNGVRLTILLDAAPVDPHALKLRAWDRTFLLDSIASVLREIPADRVRVIAFNLDQQEEIFRQDDFDRFGLGRLSRALRKLELGSISYRKLGQPQGWSELLTRLLRDEVEAKQPADAVIFLGPTTRLSDKIPKEALTLSREKRPRFYYLEYFPAWRRGSELPDAIHHLTAQCEGTVLKIHSPGEFAGAIDRLRNELRPTEAEADIPGVMKSGY